MLPKVAVGLHCCAPSTNVENYRALVGDDLVEEIQQLSRDLKDIRICPVTATASGGGIVDRSGAWLLDLHATALLVLERLNPSSYETESGRCSFEADVLYLAVLLVGDSKKRSFGKQKTRYCLRLLMMAFVFLAAHDFIV